jgi:hypothetical protein
MLGARLKSTAADSSQTPARRLYSLYGHDGNAVSIVLRCNVGWEDVREVMATSRILTLMRRTWTMAGFMFAALLAESVALLRNVVTRPGPHVRGFVPKQSSGGRPPDPGLGDLIRERISAGAP